MLIGQIQDPTSFALADRRLFLGIPNGLNVLSNLPFLAVALWGLREVKRAADMPAPDRQAYTAFFLATGATTFGSSYFHLGPSVFSLMWDRLPLAAAFMALLIITVAERYDRPLAGRLLLPLLALGPLTVVYWYFSTGWGSGDLRPYGLVQYGSLLAIVLLLVAFPRRASGTRFLAAGLMAYLLAKAFELLDGPIFQATKVVSGHTLKHLAAATGVGCVAALLRARRRGTAIDSPTLKQRSESG